MLYDLRKHQQEPPEVSGGEKRKERKDIQVPNC